MTPRSLEDAIQAAGSAVELARNSQIGPYVYPVVPPEFTNWRDEQVAWRETAALFDQSHHMTDLYRRGPGRDPAALRPRRQHVRERRRRQGEAVRLLQPGRLRDRRRDPLLPRREPRVARRPAVGPQLGAVPRRDRRLRRDRRARRAHAPSTRRAGASSTASRCRARTRSRCSSKATGGPLPEIKFFNMGRLTIAGREVRALHHGMSGAPGLELFGPWEEREDVRGAIVAAGADFGLRQVGSRAYATNTLESGWIPCPLPAVFTGEELKAYREWLPADWYEATGSLGGSLTSDDIEDYYLDAVRARLRRLRQVRPRLRRPRGARADGRSPRAGRSRSRGTARTSRARWARCSRRATRPSTSTCRSRTTRPGRTTA